MEDVQAFVHPGQCRLSLLGGIGGRSQELFSSCAQLESVRDHCEGPGRFYGAILRHDSIDA